MSGGDFPERIFAVSIGVPGREQDEMFYTEHAVDVKGLLYQVYVPTPQIDREKKGATPKGLGENIRVLREQCGMDQGELASKCELTLAELKKIERGDCDELWAGIRVFALVASAFDMPLDALTIEAPAPAALPDGEEGRKGSGEAESRKPLAKGSLRISRIKKVLPPGWR